MTQRKYSVAEIDRMRSAILYRYMPAPVKVGDFVYSTGVVIDHEKVERELRTHMLNGTDPEELEAACR